MKPEDFGSRFAADIKGLAELRTAVRNSPKDGVRAAAQQFEALFVQMMLKSMRDATPQDGLFDSDQSRFYTAMLDQQLSQNLSAKGATGLARMIEQQLGQSQSSVTDRAAELRTRTDGLPVSSSRPPAQVAVGALPAAIPWAPSSTAPDTAVPADSAARRAFVDRIWPYALNASAQTGIPAHFLVAHAALESGWGRNEIRRADGSPSHNLFGIKAGDRWLGDTVDAMTKEYVGGRPVESRERFRAYGSYADSFRDYAALLRTNPRYAPALGAATGTEFARYLQQGGYATDPMYADKLARIISGPALRQALQG